MKKCPACNRTYSDETLSFCLEDGSLLSAPFNPREEQETVVLPNKAELPPTEYFSPQKTEQSEIPTIVSAKNPVVKPPLKTQSTQSNSPAQFVGFPVEKTWMEFLRKVLLFVLVISVLLTIFTGSLLPLIIGSVIIGLMFFIGKTSF